jgi:hypothetical protein
MRWVVGEVAGRHQPQNVRTRFLDDLLRLIVLLSD